MKLIHKASAPSHKDHPTMKTSIFLSSLLATLTLSAQQARIVGGTGTTLNTHPYMTALVEKGQPPSTGQFCGAALVAPQWVLTAGHCLEGTPPGALDVWIGGRDLRNAAEGVRVAVSQIIMHPNYGTDAQGTLNYDFCLLKLARPVTEKAVLPLVEAASQVAPGINAKVIGWGDTSEGSGAGSPLLLQVDVPLVSLATANIAYGGLSSNHLAAGRPSGGIDSCQGDSGGPLMVRNAAGLWSHAGTVSFGNGCARPGQYGIYGNTLSVKSWIQSYIQPTPVDDHGNTFNLTTSSLPVNGSTTGQIQTTGDIDVFRIALPAQGNLILQSTGSTDLVGTLLTSSGATITSDDNSAGGTNFRLTYTATAATTLFLKVEGKTTSTLGAYGLTSSFSTAPLPVADIELRQGTSALSTGSSYDFGSLNTTGSTLSTTFTVVNTGTGDLTVKTPTLSPGFFSLVSVPAASLAPTKSTTFIVNYKPTTAGRHSANLTLTSNDPDESPITLTLNGTLQNSRTDDHGDTFSTATPVSIPSTRTGTIQTGIDVDTFKFTLTAPRTVILSTTGSLDSYGSLYDSKGTLLQEADDISSSNYNFIITRRLTAGTYYITVEGYSTEDIGSYTLVLK
jgi:secreted trypsin-like serine protease